MEWKNIEVETGEVFVGENSCGEVLDGNEQEMEWESVEEKVLQTGCEEVLDRNEQETEWTNMEWEGFLREYGTD
jgi:hypothetical protein